MGKPKESRNQWTVFTCDDCWKAMGNTKTKPMGPNPHIHVACCSRGTFPILSRDPSFQETILTTQNKTRSRCLKRRMVEKNGQGINPENCRRTGLRKRPGRLPEPGGPGAGWTIRLGGPRLGVPQPFFGWGGFPNEGRKRKRKAGALIVTSLLEDLAALGF